MTNMNTNELNELKKYVDREIERLRMDARNWIVHRELMRDSRQLFWAADSTQRSLDPEEPYWGTFG